MTQEPTYYTVAGVVDAFRAAGLNVRPDAVRRWVRAERVPALKLPSGEYRIRVEAIRAVIHGEDPYEAIRAADESTEGAVA